MSETYVSYLGIVHRTNEVKTFDLPKPVTLIEIVNIISALNKHAHIYGITYYMPKLEAPHEQTGQ